jgi:hypothetical protein
MFSLSHSLEILRLSPICANTKFLLIDNIGTPPIHASKIGELKPNVSIRT